MMGRSALFATMLAAFLLAAPAKAIELDQWNVSCENKAETDERLCLLSYVTRKPKASPTLGVGLIFAQLSEDPLIFLVQVNNSECAEESATIRVDRNSAVRMTRAEKGVYALLSIEASAMADQFIVGNQVLLSVYRLPGCTKTDLPVSLEGFAAAWQKFETGSK